MTAMPFGEVVLMPPASGEVAHRTLPIHEVYANAWLAGKHSTNTLDAYRRDIRTFFAWCDANGLPPLAAQRAHIDMYRRHLEAPRITADGRRLDPYRETTVARKLTAVSSYYTYVAQEAPHLLSANPAKLVDRPNISDESTTVGLDLDEARALIGAADAAGRCESAAVRLLLTTGMRVSELCGANTRDITTERGHRVLTVTRKGGRRQKLVLSPETWAAVDTYLAGRTGHIFRHGAGPMNRHQLAELVARVGRAAGLEEKRIHPHALRHTATTLALDAGATLRHVQTLMGHIDPRTTNRYDRARHDLDHSPVHLLGALLDGAPA